MVERADNGILRISSVVIGVVFGLFGCFTNASDDDYRLPETVSNFELSKYVGTWHQIAHIPNRFQAMCVDDTRAEYLPSEDSLLKVINSCRDNSSNLRVAEGVARIGSKYRDTARLEVRFAPKWLSFLPFVWGDYWVLDIDSEYTSVLVGSPDYKFLWILAREQEIPRHRYKQLEHKARELGFDTGKLVR